MASKKFALNPPLSESDRGGLERKLFGGVCGKKASLKIAWDAFKAVDATFRLFLGANRFAVSAEAYRFAGSAEARKSTSTPFVRRAPSTMENQGSRCKIAIPGVHL